MRYNDIYLAGLGARYPKGVSANEAVADGRYDRKLHSRTRQQRVAIAEADDSAPEMAAYAGRLAVRRSGHRAEDVALLLHAVATYNGMDGWNAGSYLQNKVLDGAGVAFELRQLSNGALAGVELAAAYLAADPDRSAAVITAADQFGAPTWNRWTASPGLVFADGASAAVLSRRGGFARILSCATTSDSSLEGMQRGNRPFRSAPDPRDAPVSLYDRTMEFTEVMELSEAGRRMAVGLRAAGTRAAEEAGLRLDEADHYVVPNFGWELLHNECLEPLGIDASRTTWAWGANIGHAGASDQFGALNHLAESGQLQPGQRVLMVSVGGGFTWTCAVVEILDQPLWASLPV